MRRRDLISTCGLLLLAGCTGNTADSAANQDETEEEIVVENVSTLGDATPGDNEFSVFFDVNSTKNTTISATLIDTSGSEITSTQLPVDTDAQQIVFTLSVPQNTQVSNGTVRFRSNQSTVTGQTETDVNISKLTSD